MRKLSHKDKIWNRACAGGGDSPRSGDAALVGLLLFHGPAMNGGVLHAVECLSSEQLVAAQAGYRYFGYGSVADLIGFAEASIRQGEKLELLEAEFDRRCWVLVPNDEVLIKSLEQHQQQFPLEYSPIVE